MKTHTLSPLGDGKETYKRPLDNEAIFALSGSALFVRRCGFCVLDPLTTRGKRLQLIKLLGITLLPVLCIWGFTTYILSETITSRGDIKEAQKTIKTVIMLGEVVHLLQRERDRGIFYLSDLGSGTKSFLLREYQKTDDALVAIPTWPDEFVNSKLKHFRSKSKLMTYLSVHRNALGPATVDIHYQTYFYTQIMREFLRGLYENIKEAGFGRVWKTLVAYQKMTRCLEEIALERAYGARFFVKGTFPTWDEFEYYNRKIFFYRYNYRLAAYYSVLVDHVYIKDVENFVASDVNGTDLINFYRYRIQHYNTSVNYTSLQSAEWFFDNVTVYMDSLLNLQNELSIKVLYMVEEQLNDAMNQVIMYSCLLVIVIAMCPIISFAAEAQTSNMQKYAHVLAEKTTELNHERDKTNSLLYQMLPKSVAERLKTNTQVDAEYFRSATILFSDLYGFTKIVTILNPMELVGVINTLYTAMDEKISGYDVYKVETINDCYMVVSGLPQRNGNRHASEIASLALGLLEMMKCTNHIYPDTVRHLVQLRMGMNTGACMAGIVGSIMPRYCLFGDTVNTASRMKSYGLPNRIQASEAATQALRRNGDFSIKYRGNLDIKGKGMMKTYWILGKMGSDGDLDTIHGQGHYPVPGEILPSTPPMSKVTEPALSGRSGRPSTSHDVSVLS